jgi:hypothetical protein
MDATIPHETKSRRVHAEIVDSPEELERVRKLAHFMDNCIRIPGTDFRIGFDGLIGLIPGIGDAIGLIASAIIVTTAARAQVPKVILFRMILNVLFDSIIGALPIAGDAFDFAFKSNMKNMALLEAALVNRNRTKRRSLAMVGLVILAFVLIAVLVFGLLTSAMSYVFHQLT